MKVVGILLALFAFIFAREIKVGVLLPFSGVFSDFGNQIKRGLNVIYIHHQFLPNGDRVKIIFMDNSSDKTQTILGYKRLVNEGVVAVVGPFSSSNSISVKREVNKDRVAIVLPVATSPKVTKGSDYVTRVCYTDLAQGKVLAKYALNHNWKKVFMVVDIKQQYSVGLSQAFNKYYHKKGLYPKSGTIYTNMKNFNPLISRIPKDVDVVFLPLYANEIGLFLKEFRSQGFKSNVLAGDGVIVKVVKNLAKEKANGLTFTTHFDVRKPLTNKAKIFIEKYKERYNEMPSAFSALGVDAYLIIYEALKKCDTSKNISYLRECVSENIRNTINLEGVTGKITINSTTGNPINKPIIFEEIDNKGSKVIGVER